MSRQQPGRLARAGRSLPLLVTNAIKIGGLIVAIKGVFGGHPPDALTVCLAAFMMAGAQISEDTLLSMWSRMFGHPPEHQPPSEEHRSRELDR